MAVLLKGTTFSSGQSVDHTDMNNIIDTATLNPNQTDGIIGSQAEKTSIASTDRILIQDMAGTNLLKRATIANIIGGSGIVQTDEATGVGKSALAALTSGTDNVAVGYSALYTMASGTFNTAVGSNALKVATGNANTAVGGDSMKATVGGDFNVAVGVDTLLNNVSGTMNTAVGMDALEDNTASYNTGIGANAAKNITSGANNTAVGVQSLFANSTGGYNTAVGFESLRNNVAGANTAVGYNSAKENTSGTANTAVGSEALLTNSTGTSNVAVGYDALKLNTAGGNVAVGAYALDGATTGGFNTAVGGSAGGGMADGGWNTTVGYQAGVNISSGDANVCLGHTANTLTTGDNNITIGHGADVSTGAAANQIVIGDGIAATANDQFSIGKVSNVVSNDFGTDAAWSRASDERKKQDIRPDPLGLDFVNELRPVTYRWRPIAQWPSEWAESKGDEVDTETVMHGMLAQEVKSALDKAGVGTFSGWKERPDGQQALALESFIMPLIKAVQELSAKVEKLEAK